MATTDLTGKSVKHRSINEVLNSPALRAKLTSYADEIIIARQKIQREQEHIKQVRESALEDLHLKGPVFNSFVDMMFKNDFIQRREKFEELFDMVDIVMRDSGMEMLTGPDEG
jgi:hypothetical protein